MAMGLFKSANPAVAAVDRPDPLRAVFPEKAPAPPAPPADKRAEISQNLYERLVSTISPTRVEHVSETELRQQLLQTAEELASRDLEPLDDLERETVVSRVIDDLVGYGPIAGLLREFDVSEILINGPRQVFVERRGLLSPSDVTFHDHEHLLRIIGRLISKSGRRLDKSSPMIDARMPDGSRLNAVLNPPALNGPLVSIRRFGVRPLTADDMLAKDSLTIEMLDFLAACVKGRINMIISGGTGSGKTTLLNCMSRFIPSVERVVSIEDTAELELQQPHVAKLEAQPANEDGLGGVTMRDLVRNALRMRPDRIIVGECRGGEAFEMLQAMSTGHDGSMTTIHASNPREALTRVELIVGLAGMEIPVWAVRKLISSSINLVVQTSRLAGGKRKVTSISEITGMEGDTITMQDIFSFVQTGMHTDLGAEGYFCATGMRPHLINKLKVRGAGLPHEMFADRHLQLPSQRGTAR
jgi:pilus assembly protein CpaF